MPQNYAFSLREIYDYVKDKQYMIHNGDSVIVPPVSLDQLGRKYAEYLTTGDGQRTSTLSTEPDFQYVRTSKGFFAVKQLEPFEISVFEMNVLKALKGK